MDDSWTEIRSAHLLASGYRISLLYLNNFLLCDSQSQGHDEKDGKTDETWKRVNRCQTYLLNYGNIMFHSILACHQASVLSLQHEGFFARAKVGGLEQREPAKRSARGLALIVRCQAPGKPPPDSSQIFLRAKKRASSSDDDESLRRLLQFLNTTFRHLKFVLDSFLRIEFHMKREKSSCCKNQSEQTRRPL